MLNKIVNDFITSPHFLFGDDGHVEFENGLIVQWGVASITTSIANYPLPREFPNKFLIGFVCDITGSTVASCAVTNTSTKSAIGLVGQSGTVNYLAIGI